MLHDICVWSCTYNVQCIRTKFWLMYFIQPGFFLIFARDKERKKKQQNVRKLYWKVKIKKKNT